MIYNNKRPLRKIKIILSLIEIRFKHWGRNEMLQEHPSRIRRKRQCMFKSMQKRIFLGYLLITYSLFFLSFFILYELQTENLLDQTIKNSMDLNEVYAEQMGDDIQKKIDALKTIADTQRQGLNRDDMTMRLRRLVENDHYGFLTGFLSMKQVGHTFQTAK